MKTAFTFLTLAAIAAPAFAANGAPQETTLDSVRATQPAPIGGHRALQLLGLETDLDANQVRMVLVTEAHQARYRVRSDRDVARKFANALGTERYTDLIEGQPIALSSPAVLEAARQMGMAIAASPQAPAILVASNP